MRAWLCAAFLFLGGCGGPQPEPQPEPPVAPAAQALDERMGRPDERYLQTALADDPQRWVDETSGPTATLVYVTTQRGGDDRVQPMAIVISSDPGHGQFQRHDSARVTVRRMKRAALGELLRELESDGLRRLPLTPEPYDQAIGPERALLLFEGGRRGRVLKSALQGDPPALTAFTAIERRLIRFTMPGQ